MLIYLTPGDFFVSQHGQLSNKINGYSVVFFSSSNCVYCRNIMPSFVQLSRSLQGCTFGLMNVDQDGQKIVALSAQSQNRLEYVPYILFYVNGVPYAEFNPDENTPSANYELLKKFLIDTTASVKSQLNRDPSEPISIYSIGIPGNKKKVCYLTYEKAYTKS